MNSKGLIWAIIITLINGIQVGAQFDNNKTLYQRNDGGVTVVDPDKNMFGDTVYKVRKYDSADQAYSAEYGLQTAVVGAAVVFAIEAGKAAIDVGQQAGTATLDWWRFNGQPMVNAGAGAVADAAIKVARTVMGQPIYPSWIGVYGSTQRHSGENPGTFTILMNKDYWGLNADIVMQVNHPSLGSESGKWRGFRMDYAGKQDGNSIRTFKPPVPYPEGTKIFYSFHCVDDWGWSYWDNNGGKNYAILVVRDPQ